MLVSSEDRLRRLHIPCLRGAWRILVRSDDPSTFGRCFTEYTTLHGYFFCWLIRVPLPPS